MNFVRKASYPEDIDDPKKRIKVSFIKFGGFLGSNLFF